MADPWEPRRLRGCTYTSDNYRLRTPDHQKTHGRHIEEKENIGQESHEESVSGVESGGHCSQGTDRSVSAAAGGQAVNSAHCGSVTASGVLANGKEVEHEQTQEVVEEMEEEEERNKEKKQTSRKRTWKTREKTKATSSVRFKLWEPLDCARDRADISELDVCLTVYDEVMQRAMENEMDSTVRDVMYTHLKRTRKAMLTQIKNVHMLRSVRSKLRQERVKQKKLQQLIQKIIKDMGGQAKDYYHYTDLLEKNKQNDELSSLD